MDLKKQPWLLLRSGKVFLDTGANLPRRVRVVTRLLISYLKLLHWQLFVYIANTLAYINGATGCPQIYRYCFEYIYIFLLISNNNFNMRVWFSSLSVEGPRGSQRGRSEGKPRSRHLQLWGDSVWSGDQGLSVQQRDFVLDHRRWHFLRMNFIESNVFAS